MKLIRIFLLILLSNTGFSQSIQINLSSSSINFQVSQSDSVVAQIVPSGGFNQQLIFSETCMSGNCTGLSVTFSPNPVSYPYTGGVTILVSSTGACIPGNYTYLISAANGPVADSTLLSVNVVSTNCSFTTLNHTTNHSTRHILANSLGVWTAAFDLVRYFGGNWTEYTTTNSQLPGYCNDMAEDSYHNIWLATENGIAKFDGTFWTIYNTSNTTLVTNWFVSIAIDSSDNVWIAASINHATGEGIGLYKFDGTSFTLFDSLNTPLPTNLIDDLSFDRNGLLWMNVQSYSPFENQIAKFDGTNWTFVTYSTSCLPKYGYRTKFSFDSQNNAWFGIGTSNSLGPYPAPNEMGMVKYDGSNWEIWCDSSLVTYNHFSYNSNCTINFQDHNSKFPYQNPSQVFVDSYDRVWASSQFSTGGRGLVLFDGFNFDVFNSNNSLLPWNAITGITELNDTVYFSSSIDYTSSGGKLSYYTCGGVPTGIQDNKGASKISLYPNPASETISFQFSGENNLNGTISIYDLTGKKLLEQSINEQQTKMNIEHLNDGFYFYLYRGECESFSGKFIVCR